MAKITKCNNCGSDLAFDPEKNMLVCKSCGGNFPVRVPSGAVKRNVYTIEYNPEDNRKEETQYVCPACGSKIMAGREKPLSICASCGNTELKVQTNSVAVPDGIIPFAINKEKAGEIFRKFVRSRKFAPSDLEQMAKLQKIIGLYCPVWKFDFEARTRYSYVGIKTFVDDHDHERIRPYPNEKNKEKDYNDILLSGNKQISDYTLDKIGNFDFSKTVPYSSDYVLGFYLTDTNRNIHTVYDNYKDKLEEDTKKSIEKSINDDYDRIDNFVCRTRFVNEVFNYIGVPIYANHYTYKGKNYHCYINGQTGKFTGSAPKSIWKILGAIGAGVLGVGLLILLLSRLF